MGTFLMLNINLLSQLWHTHTHNHHHLTSSDLVSPLHLTDRLNLLLNMAVTVFLSYSLSCLHILSVRLVCLSICLSSSNPYCESRPSVCISFSVWASSCHLFNSITVYKLLLLICLLSNQEVGKQTTANTHTLPLSLSVCRILVMLMMKIHISRCIIKSKIIIV